MTITHGTTAAAVTEADVDRAMAFADAAQGLAGHQVTDPVLRELARNSLRGYISAEEAITRGLTHIDELERKMALIEKSQQLAGHFPSTEALGLARRILTGETTAAEADAELDASFPRA